MRLEDIYDPEEEQRRIFAILAPRFLRWLDALTEAFGSIFQLTPDEFRVDDVATRKMLALAADRAMLVEEGNRPALRRVLQEGQRRGYSDFEVAEGVPADGFGGIRAIPGESWGSRPAAIARTEMATAMVAASLDRYAATGLVDEVEIVENEDTDEPCASRNGKVVPLSSRPQLLHPNCRMSLIPRIREEAA